MNRTLNKTIKLSRKILIFISFFRYANSAQGGTTAGCPGGPVKVSFVSLPKPVQQQPSSASEVTEATVQVTAPESTSLVTLDRITFNYGREIFVYPYRGVRKAADLTKPIDKR